MKFNLYIAEIQYEEIGTLYHKFLSMREYNLWRKKIPAEAKTKIVKKYEDISFEESNLLWKKPAKELAK